MQYVDNVKGMQGWNTFTKGIMRMMVIKKKKKRFMFQTISRDSGWRKIWMEICRYGLILGKI